MNKHNVNTDVALKQDDRGFRRIGLFVVLGMLGGFLLWSAFAPLTSAVVATGKVVVETRNKVVQHLDGGIVANIHVKEGDLVTKGQKLLTLSSIQLQSQLDIVQRQYWEATVNLDRLQAEQEQQETLSFSAQVLAQANEPQLAAQLRTQQQLFKVRRQAFHSEQSVLTQKVSQANSQIHGLEKLIQSHQSRSKSLAQDIQDWQALYEQQFADKVRLREMERQQSELQGDISAKQSEIQRLAQVIVETKRQMLLRQEEYLKEVSNQLRETQTQQTEALSKLSALQDQLKRIDILSPDDGQVVGFDVVTLGAVIEPRKTIMEIVPQHQSYAVIAQVQLQDIDQVQVGQTAEIKFTAFNTNYSPVLYGKVANLSSDALLDETNRTYYYKVNVTPGTEVHTELEKQQWSLVSGMPADVYIQTRERTLLGYLIKPLQLMITRAFNEDDGLSP